MMTDPMKPLGLSFWKLTALPPMHEAGGRLFVDVTERLASPASRSAVLEALGRADPLIRDALQTVLDRGDFVPLRPDDTPAPLRTCSPTEIDPDPVVAASLIDANETSVAALQRDIRAKSGPALLDFILEDIQELRRLLFDPHSHRVFSAAMDATWWLNEHLHEWLGEKNVADTLTQSAPHNVTSEMGLGLLDVADVIRPHAEVVALLRHVEDDEFLDDLAELEGGREARDALLAYLDRYGMRCVGEIDITRPRWSEHPTALVPMILSNVDSFEPGEAERRFEQGRREARAKAREVLERVRALPDGEVKEKETKRKIDLVRTFIGYREYPKYGMVRRYGLYKKALLDEAARLVEGGVIGEVDDVFFMTFQELHAVVSKGQVDHALIRSRKDAFRSYEGLTPPRVLTSDGEALAGEYRRDDVPVGALVGQAASAGTVEGRARIILDMAEADLEPGDILVTAYTDPSWSPLFVMAAGVVTEVGGVMTHGAVVAREYGLPAVVGVEHATQLILDGQRIRVDGIEGIVELLPDRVAVHRRRVVLCAVGMVQRRRRALGLAGTNGDSHCETSRTHRSASGSASGSSQSPCRTWGPACGPCCPHEGGSTTSRAGPLGLSPPSRRTTRTWPLTRERGCSQRAWCSCWRRGSPTADPSTSHFSHSRRSPCRTPRTTRSTPLRA